MGVTITISIIIKIKYQKPSSINNQREFDSELDPGIVGRIEFQADLRTVKYFIGTRRRQKKMTGTYP